MLLITHKFPSDIRFSKIGHTVRGQPGAKTQYGVLTGRGQCFGIVHKDDL